MSLLFNPSSDFTHQALFYAVKKCVYMRNVKTKNDVPMTNNVVVFMLLY